MFKILRREIYVDRTGAVSQFSRTLAHARVAELADAVDSKSTDESIVGSTPTPGTSFRGEQIIGTGTGTDE